MVTFVAGGIAGILSWVPTYPQDVIKTRLQADHIGAKAFYKNTWHCIQCTLKDSGVGILYRGMGSCIYRAFVVNSVVFSVYTQVTSKFQEDNKSDVFSSSKWYIQIIRHSSLCII